MFRLPEPRDYQSCRDRLAIVLSQIEVFEETGCYSAARHARLEARRLDLLSKQLPRMFMQVA